MNRRDFLKLLGSSSMLIIPSVSLALDTGEKLGNKKQKNGYIVSDEFWNQPRKLNLKRMGSDEHIDLVFWKNGNIDHNNYQKITSLLRDVVQDQIHPIDLKLLNLLCAIQAWLVSYGYTAPINIHSGYRSKKTNQQTEGAAKNSYHVRGKAIDFSVDNLSPNHLTTIAKAFEVGGVGFYPGRDFIHIDTGDVRYWRN